MTSYAYLEDEARSEFKPLGFWFNSVSDPGLNPDSGSDSGSELNLTFTHTFEELLMMLPVKQYPGPYLEYKDRLKNGQVFLNGVVVVRHSHLREQKHLL